VKSRLIRWLLALVILGVGATFGFRAWRGHVVRVQDENAYRAARKALQEHRPEDALALFRAQDHSASPLPWNEVEVEACVGARQLPQLLALYERSPKRILQNDGASLLVARTFLHSRRPKDLARLREKRQGQDQNSPEWFALDIDALLLNGRPDEARRLLLARTFPGTNDVPRLVRLALISSRKDLPAAWNHLADAARLDARNPEVRSFRAQILEQIGKVELARVEYVAAHVAEPANPLLRDQLAEFYRRQGSLDHALTTWEEALRGPSLDFIWVKALFWGRMIRPLTLAPGSTPPSGHYKPLAEYLRQLPARTFWESEDLRHPPGSRKFGQDRQEVFWLQLAGLLQAHQDKAAFELLSFHRSPAGSWDPDLERALGRILSFRLNQTLNPPGTSFATGGRSSEDLHQFFRQLEDLARREREGGRSWKMPADMAAFLIGPSAPGSAFLAAGWREAALTLLPDPLPAGSPGWLDYGVAQVRRYNRSPADALQFLATRPASPPLDLLRGELLIAVGKSEDGLRLLQPLASLDSDIGFRAAWLRALADMEHTNTAGVRQQVSAQPRLAKSPVGTELLARAALADGREEEAQRLYHRVATNSVEARTYLARQAFAAKDWTSARRYTTELLTLMPDELQLRENLAAIDRAESSP